MFSLYSCSLGADVKQMENRYRKGKTDRSQFGYQHLSVFECGTYCTGFSRRPELNRCRSGFKERLNLTIA